MMLVIKKKVVKNNNEFQAGAIAQLGERLHGMQEVSGSIPLSSTRIPRRLSGKKALQVAKKFC